MFGNNLPGVLPSDWSEEGKSPEGIFDGGEGVNNFMGDGF